MIDTIHMTYDFKSRTEMDSCIESLKNRYSLDSTYRETNDKFICGNNVENINSNMVINAYNLLINYFDFIDWNKGVHKRIDIGINVALSSSPNLLTDKIIGSKRMKKSTVTSNSESVIIGNKSQSIIFYNKTLESEAKTKKMINVPSNLLRIEYRIMSSYPMKKYFGTDRVTIPFILKNLEMLPNIWYEMYLSVEKDYSTGIDLFSNKKEMEMKAIVHFGVEPMKTLIIESYRAKKMALSTKQNLLRYLKEIIDYQRSNTNSFDIVKELDDRVGEFIHEKRFFDLCTSPI